MKIFTVHSKGNTLDALEDIVLVEEGFSWLAAILHVFYTLYNKMWLVSLVLFTIEIILVTLELQNIVSNPILNAIRMGFLLFVGASFNDWQRNLLDKKGYIFQGVTSGKNEEEARYKYMTNMLHCTTFASGNRPPELLY